MHTALLCGGEGARSVKDSINNIITAVHEAPSDLVRSIIRVTLSPKDTGGTPAKVEVLSPILADTLINYMPKSETRGPEDDYSLDFEDPAALHHVSCIGTGTLVQVFLYTGVYVNR